MALGTTHVATNTTVENFTLTSIHVESGTIWAMQQFFDVLFLTDELIMITRIHKD